MYLFSLTYFFEIRIKMNDRIAYEKRNNDRIKLSKAIMLSSSIIHGFDDLPRIYTISEFVRDTLCHKKTVISYAVH
jgi:hypothetical protein